MTVWIGPDDARWEEARLRACALIAEDILQWRAERAVQAAQENKEADLLAEDRPRPKVLNPSPLSIAQVEADMNPEPLLVVNLFDVAGA